MKKRLYRILAVLGVGLGLFLLVLACIALYVNTDHAQAVAKRIINHRIPGKVEWTRLHLSLYRGNAELQGLRIKGVNEADIAGWQRLHISWSWPDLLTGELIVEGGLEKPWAHLEQDVDANLNLANALLKAKPESPKEETSGTFPLNVSIRSFQAKEGSFRFRDNETPLLAEIDGIELSLSGSVARAVAEAQLQFTGGRLGIREFETRLKPSSLAARYADNRIGDVRMELSTERAHAVITGGVEDPLDKRLLNLKGDLSAALEDVAQLLGLGTAFNGTANLRVNARGAPDNPDVDLELFYGGGTVFGRTIGSLASTVNLADRRLRIDDLTVTAGTGKLHLEGKADLQPVFPGGFFDSNPDFNALTYQLKLEQKKLPLRALLGQASTMAGEVDARMSLSGQGISPENLNIAGSIEAEGRHITANEKVPPVSVRLSSELELDQGRASLRQLSAEAGELKLETRGEINLYTKAVSAEFRLEAPHLSKALTPLGIRAVSGSALVNGNISGTFQQPEFDFLFGGSMLAYNDIRLGDVRLNASMDAEGMLRIARLSIENQGSVLRGEGNIKLFTNSGQLESNPPLDLELTLSDIEAVDFVDADLATGRLDGSIKLEGTARAPRARLKLEGRGIGVENISVGDVTALLEFGDGGLTLENVKVVNDDAVVHITGTAQLIDPETFELIQDPAMDLAVKGEHIALESYLAEYKGRFSIDARLMGNLKSPQGPVTIRGHGFKSPWQNLEEIDLAARLEGDSLKVDRLALSPAPAEWIIISGRVSLESLSEVNISTDGVSLEHIQWLKENVPIAGKLKGQLEGDGPFKDLSVSGTLALTQFIAAGKPIADIRADVSLADHEVRLDAQHAGADLNVRYHLLQKAISGSSRIHTDDLGPYLALLGPNDFGGLVHGTLRIDGHLDDPEKLAVSVDLERGRVDFKGQAMLRTDPARIYFENGQLHVPGWNLRLLDEGRLRVKGTGRTGGAIDFEVEGEVPLAVGQAFLNDLVDLSGDLVLSATVRGEWDRPDIRGNISLESAAMTLPGSGQKLHSINAALALAPDRISISQFHGMLDEGSFHLSGGLELNDLRPGPVNLILSTTDLPLMAPDALEVFLYSRLELNGTPDNATLTGNVVIQNGLYYKDVALNPLDMLQPREKRAVKPEPPEIRLPYLKNLGLNVKVSGRNPFRVDNNLAKLMVVPDIRITGTLQQRRITGRADIPDGVIQFHTRRFQVVRGAIDFVRPFEIQPELNIRGETEIRQWTVYVDVTGPLDNLLLTLSSNPSEEPGNILSLILTGRTSAELSAGGGGRRNVTAEILAGVATSSLGEEIRDFTGLDTFEAYTVADRDANTENTRVTIGRNLSERITLRYGVESKQGVLVRKTIAEMQLLERVLMSGFQDSRGSSGGALVFRIEFW